MLAVVMADTACRFASNTVASLPSHRAVIARESLRVDRDTVSSKITQNWNCLIIRFFALLRMTGRLSKRHFFAKNVPFSLIFPSVLGDPLRRSESGFVTKCLRFCRLTAKPSLEESRACSTRRGASARLRTEEKPTRPILPFNEKKTLLSLVMSLICTTFAYECLIS